MPMFRKSSHDKERKKKLLQHKLVLAEDKPDSIFDLSECGISKIPDGVFSKCKVLQKQALILQHNNLVEIKGGGDLTQLSSLLILDISHNILSMLNKNIGAVTSLQKLDLSHNNLKRLPNSLGNLTNLQVLSLNVNQLTNLPSSIKSLRKLQELDITENKWLTNLPLALCYLTQLEVFRFDVEKITYPQRAITVGGITEIRKWFAKVKGDQFGIDLPDQGSSNSKIYPSLPASPPKDDGFEEMIAERERQKDLVTKQRLQLEQEIADAQTRNAKLVFDAQNQRHKVLVNVAKNEIDAQNELVKQFDHHDKERRKLVEQLNQEEATTTIELVLEMSKRAKKTEEILDQLEKEQNRIDHLVRISNEESDRLRKEEMIESMASALREMIESQKKWDRFEAMRESTWKTSLQCTIEDNKGLENLFQEKEKTQKKLINAIVTEEENQMKAFEILQFQKDNKLIRIKKQVDMIQTELARLSKLEIQKRQEKAKDEMNTLSEMRVNAAMLLSQLVGEQNKREAMLKETIKKMEEKREDDVKDYWLIQFQRLMDSKPGVLFDDENNLDVFVIDSLVNAGTKEYMPHFARHKVSESVMKCMTKENLSEIGVKNVNDQEAILAAVKSQMLLEESIVKKDDAFCNPEFRADASPSAPVLQRNYSACAAICMESECVICLDLTPEVVFLPCGHVCTCANCCLFVNTCPLCRQQILQKVGLNV